MLEKIEGRKKKELKRIIVGWHQQLSRYEFEKTLRDSKGQRSLAFCSSWGHKELDTS